MNTLFIIGYMGSGKTTVGNLLAQRLGWRFIDTDAVIEQRLHDTCRHIIEQQGIEYFRHLERELLYDLSGKNIDNMVIATGGGMPCNDDSIKLVKQTGRVIYLKWSAEHLATRLLLTNLENRPLLSRMTPQQLASHISEDLKQREIYYSQADITVQAPVDSDTCSADDDRKIADKIITLI